MGNEIKQDTAQAIARRLIRQEHQDRRELLKLYKTIQEQATEHPELTSLLVDLAKLKQKSGSRQQSVISSGALDKSDTEEQGDTKDDLDFETLLAEIQASAEYARPPSNAPSW